MNRSLSAAAAALALVILVPSGAGARQLDAAESPRTKGALRDASASYSGPRCERSRLKDDGELVAVSRYCWTYLRLARRSETDENNDYGALWIQGTVDARNGWCATRVRSGLAVAEGTPIHAITGKKIVTSARQRYVQRLRIDAAGTATDAAVVKQDLVLRPGKMNGTLLNDNELKLVWTGKTKNKVAVAGGLEISVPAGSAGPGFVPSLAPRLARC